MFSRVKQSAAAILAAATMSVAAIPANAQSVPESGDTIKIAIHEWTGQHITSYIAGNILQRMGYSVEYVTAGIFPSAVAVADGNLTASLELWSNNLGNFYPDMLKEGKIVDLGSMGLDAREGWLYPVTTKEQCPGLPAWDALLSCADKFATAETFPKGRFVAYPADWGDRSTRLINEQGLAFDPVAAGSEGALVAELKAAVLKKQPLVMMFWAPQWVLGDIETEWVDIPEDLVQKYGLQKPTVFKAVWPGTEQKWPAAFKFLKAYKINNKIQQDLMNLIDNQGKDALEVTKNWVDKNEDYWRPMVAEALTN